MPEHSPPPLHPDSSEGSLLVEDQRFSIVPEWVIDADLPDGAFRLYALLLRYGNTTGQRMPARPTLARRLHRSVDAVDRAMRQLVTAGVVRVEHRRTGDQYLSNRYHLRTSAPFPPPQEGGGRIFAATPPEPVGGGRRFAATPGRTSAARVAAEVRPYPEVLTQSTKPPPPCAPATGASFTADGRTAVAVADTELLTVCGVNDLDELSRRCIAARIALNQPGGRWAPQCLTVAIRMAVVNRGWPATDAAAALLAVAGDKATRSPVRVAEAGPWWDQAPLAVGDACDGDALAAAEARLADLGGSRVTVQAQARAELAQEGMPLTRITVTRRAIQILDRTDAIA